MQCVSELKMNWNPLRRSGYTWKYLDGVFWYGRSQYLFLPPFLPFLVLEKARSRSSPVLTPRWAELPLQLLGESSYGLYQAGFLGLPAADMNSG